MTQFINQRTLTDLKTMSPEAIAEAVAAGQCAELMGAAAPIDIQATAGESEPRMPAPNPGQAGAAPHAPVPAVQLDQEDLKTMSPEAIVEATRRGEFSNVLGSAPKPSISPRQ